MCIVPDRRRRDNPKVVVARRGCLGFGEVGRGRVGRGLGQGRSVYSTSNLGLRWTDPVTARRVPSK
jgi:hypothetical protein